MNTMYHLPIENFLVIAIVWLTTSVWGFSHPPVLDIGRLETPEPGACQDDLHTLKHGLHNDQPWALYMWDATVKAPVGVMTKMDSQFGDFDECLSVSDPIIAQYCLVDIEGNSTLWRKIHWGVCVPSSCSAHALQASIQDYMDTEAASVQVHVLPHACTTKASTTSNFSTGDILLCLLLLSIVTIVTAATIYDLKARPTFDSSIPPSRVIECLSVRHGWSNLFFYEKQTPGVDLSCFCGFHTICSFFIVLSHRITSYYMLKVPVANYLGVMAYFKSWLSLFAAHGGLLVDLFFTMASFLMSFTLAAKLENGTLNTWKTCIHRLSRIMPAYVVVLAFTATLLQHLGDGPAWNRLVQEEQEFCTKQWWNNLLFINNYVGFNQICIFLSWHLSCDMQLYLMGMVLLMILHRNIKVGAIVVTGVFLASTLATFLATYLYDRPPILTFTKEQISDIRNNDMGIVYTQAHYRVTSYLPGLLAGFYVFKNRAATLCKEKTVWLQTLGMTTLFSIWFTGFVFYDADLTPGPFWGSVYAATYHTIVGIAGSTLLVTFTIGQPTWLSRLFSWRRFLTPSKLVFSVTLVHTVVQIVRIASLRYPVQITLKDLLVETTVDYALSLVLALCLYLTVEMPAMYLVNLALRTGNPTKKEHEE